MANLDLRNLDLRNLEPGTPASKLAAALLTVALLAAIGLGVVLPGFGLIDTLGERRARVELQAEAQRRLAGRKPAQEAALADLLARGSQDFIQGQTPALAGAGLQSLLAMQVKTNGGRLDSTQVLDDRDEEGFRRIAVEVRMSAEIGPLQALFHAIESGRPRLVIDALAVRAPAPGVPTLEVTFTAYGFQEAGS